MCTLTIQRTAQTLLVTMNRDESRFRAPERPPSKTRSEAHGVEWLAPVDGEAGGTWIATNDRAVHACLLNRYLPGDFASFATNPERRSRGRIVADLMEQGDEAAVLQWIESVFDPTPFASFLLIALGPRQTRSFSWDGRTLGYENHDGEWLLFTSSLWRTHEVIQYRHREFDAWVRQGASFHASIPAFHLLEPQDMLEWAPLMQREHSATRSLTQIETNFALGQTEMRYWPRETLVPLGLPLSKSQLTIRNETTERRT